MSLFFFGSFFIAYLTLSENSDGELLITSHYITAISYKITKNRAFCVESIAANVTFAVNSAPATSRHTEDLT